MLTKRVRSRKLVVLGHTGARGISVVEFLVVLLCPPVPPVVKISSAAKLEPQPEGRPFVPFALPALTLAIAISFSGAIKFMIRIQKLHLRVTALAVFVLFAVTLTFPQQKEGNRKVDAAQKNTPTASEPSAKDDKDKDEKNEGDPLFKGMKYRSIGPFRGGRSLTAAGIPGDPTIYYFGSTGGGVWKSTDAANTWSPIFDKDGAPSIGSIAVAVSDPNVVYVGTGEACIRGNISHGDGIWKSVDAGKSWKNVGLKDSRAIGKLIVNPRNPDIVFVAALGHPFGPNTERGIFRTTDGGKTWEKVLYKDENTGAIDVAFDPQNPNILFASLWQARRTPWSLSSGGPGSGVYRSTDSGATWKKLDEHGLPKGPYRRIGLAVSGKSQRVDPNGAGKEGGADRSQRRGRNLGLW